MVAILKCRNYDLERSSFFQKHYCGGKKWEKENTFTLIAKSGSIRVYMPVASVRVIYKCSADKNPGGEMMKGLTKQNDYISFGDFILENEKIILSSNRMNGLFIIDQQDKQKMKIERFLGVPEEKQYYHRQICRWKDTLYFVSNGSDIVNVYNLKTEKQTVIEIGILFRCTYAFIKDDRLFMIPLYGTDEMISIGLIKNDVRKENWWNLSQYHMDVWARSSGFWMICGNWRA